MSERLRNAAARHLAEDDREETEASIAESRFERAAATVGEPGEETRKPCDAATARMLAGLAWSLLDRAVVNFAGAKWALTEEGMERQVAASIPVVQLYVPELGPSGPWGGLLAATAITYGALAFAAEPEPKNGATAPEAPVEKPAAQVAA